MINHATSRPEPMLHISEQFVGFEMPKSLWLIIHSMVLQIQFAAAKGRWLVVVGFLRGFWIWIIIAFLQLEGKWLEFQVFKQLIV